jgi:hypothetical protein
MQTQLFKKTVVIQYYSNKSGNFDANGCAKFYVELIKDDATKHKL